MKYTQKSFHKINDVFIISVDGEQLFLNKLDLQKKKIEISCTSGFNEPLLILMVEYFLRLAAIEYEIILVHAGAVSINRFGELYLGWAGAGKTSAVISKINKGYSYLAEDRIWLDDSKVYSYPRYIRVNYSNAHILKKYLSFSKSKICCDIIFENILRRAFNNKVYKFVLKLLNPSQKYK